MPKIVPTEQRMNVINLMLNGMGQRDIERETGLSRPYIRKLAKETGHVFPRNGVEIRGILCICTNCDSFFYRPQSRVDRADKIFCDEDCRKIYSVGSNHPNWKIGTYSNTFSKWIKNQKSYHEWTKKVLEKDGYKCVISGKTDDLHVHHILPKKESANPELSLSLENGLTLNAEVHREIHALIHSGIGYEEAVIQLKEKYNKGMNNEKID